MLQISSGKFFSRNIENSNQLRDIIYTNLTSIRGQKLETAAGILTATDDNYGLNAFVYEFTEYVTPSPPAPGVVVSYGIGSLILDFSSILSFSLNCTASPSYSLTERIVSDQAGVTTQYAPKKMVKKVFDQEAICSNEDIERFVEFTKHLIGLERKVYLGVMRSIRTYVTAMQRIADDFELAYTLLVASLESLAQDFDGHKATWEDYSEDKRKRIDDALSNTDDLTADKVREALLITEHTSLGKRFRDFTISHISSEFYRGKAIDTINPISKLDIPLALKHAYQARSSYIHELKKLPDQLSRPTHYSETCIVKDQPWLTLQGLSRLAQEVITNFIMAQRTVESELYDYQLEIPNIMELKFDPSIWIHEVNFTDGAGIKKLEGHLNQISDSMLEKSNAKITDLTEVLENFEKNIHSLRKEDKISFMALYLIFNHFKSEENIEKPKAFFTKHKNNISFENPKGLILYHLTNINIDKIWNIEKHKEIIDTYFKQRYNKNKILYPKIYETNILLQIANRYHSEGNNLVALEMIARAVENNPGCEALLQLEQDYKSQPKKINWLKISIPSKSL